MSEVTTFPSPTQPLQKGKLINKLYYGDCLDIMRDFARESVDLIYLDPPFNSNRAYNAIYKDETGRELPDQVEAFCDVWTMTAEREQKMIDFKSALASKGDFVARILNMWHSALRDSNPKLLAYTYYMAERLIEMYPIMKANSTIYLHCDPTASHYIKPIMDAIFGQKNYRNEIIWWYDTGGMSKRDFSRKHDVILRYSKTDSYTFNVDAIKEPKNEQQRKRYEMSKKWGDASTYRLSSDLKHPHDVLKIHAINPKAKERVGYPTQKPLSLLKKLILASSNEGDVVLDPFCGCATTICAAHELKRLWIGIDIAIHAIKRVAKSRLQDNYRLIEDEHYVIKGIPRNIEGAKDLWQRDHFQFQKWAVEQVEGFVTTRKTADRGIDGRIYFRLKGYAEHSSMVIEVKGGKNINREVVGQLRGVMERETDSVMAGLIVLEELGAQKKANFIDEMAKAGQLDDDGRKYKKMQMLNISEILNGRSFDTPYVEGKGKRQKVLKVTE